MFNPMTQQEKVRPRRGICAALGCRSCGKFPQDTLVRPWKMTGEEQEEAGCLIGKDYPEPVVDHAGGAGDSRSSGTVPRPTHPSDGDWRG